MRILALFFFAAAAFGRTRIAPTQELLEADLVIAQAAWGAPADISGIAMGLLNDCAAPNEPAGWSDLVTRLITINSACLWDDELLQVAVTHEYGHMVLCSSVHSLDRRSVMYSRLRRGQRVMPEDLERVRELQERIRPTILMPHLP